MSDTAVFAKPIGSKMRRPDAMVKGMAYKLTALAREKSKFVDKKTGKEIFKTLAVYEDFDMIFFTYMPYKFDNKPDDYYISKNKDIKEGKNLRVVYYGKIAGSIELELLEEGQDVNQTKLQGVKTIMELEAGDEPSSKRLKTD